MHLSESAGIAKKEPLVSIVIPVYNVGAYLSECLESLMNQTYRNIEMVVIDDGSTDDSSVICDQYAEKDSRIRVFHQNNHGMSHARNRGITLARGDYLRFIDSDDWMEINAIETLVHTMQQSQADIVTAGLFADYTDKTVISANKREQITIVKGQEILRTFYDGVIRDLAWNKLYRIDVFKEIRFPVDRYYEDIATTWKIMKNLSETDGVIVVLPDYLYHYRVRKGSISHGRSFKNVTDYWDAYIVQYNAFPAYRKQIVKGCMIAIGKMWLSYSGFSREEKAKSAELTLEMRQFAKAHYRQIIKGNYANRVKLYCLLSRFNSTAVKWLSYNIGNAMMWVRKYRRNYFE